MKKIITVRNFLWLFFWVYFILLMVLLVTPYPAATLGMKRVPWFPGDDIGIHFCAFCLLAVFFHAASWPMPIRWVWILLLLGYGIATETFQAFVPYRSCELKDYFDNCLGVFGGSFLYWVLLCGWHVWKRKRNDTAVIGSTDK
jgi:hypothetical protein